MKTTVASLKKMSKQGKFTPAKPSAFNYQPLFLPVATEGHAIMKVTARHEFINNNVKEWRLFHTTRAISIIAAIGTLVLFPISPYASAASAITAGWYYGEFLKKDFNINKQLRERDMIEST